MFSAVVISHIGHRFSNWAILGVALKKVFSRPVTNSVGIVDPLRHWVSYHGATPDTTVLRLCLFLVSNLHALMVRLTQFQTTVLNMISILYLLFKMVNNPNANR